MFYMYILESVSTGKLYIGQTQNLEQRLVRHNSGGSVYTRNRGPWVLLYAIDFPTRAEAVNLEKKIKGFKNSKKVRQWIDFRKVRASRQ